jgi:RecA/RadA recombinase
MKKADKDKLAKERGGRLAKNKKDKKVKSPYVSTGSTMLDLSLGGGDSLDKGGMGVKVGDIFNACGDSSSGKSFLACEIIANAKKDVEEGKFEEFGINKFKWVFNDVESGYNFDSQALWGFAIQPDEKEDRFRTSTIEKCSSHIQLTLEKLKEDELLVYVIDSWDALSSDANVSRNKDRLIKHKKDEEFDKGSMGMDKNKFIGQEFFNPIQSLMVKKNCILILVSQLRLNVNAGMFDKKWRIGSEAVMKFFCDTRAMIKTIEKFESSVYVPETGETTERWLGSSVSANPLKTRHSRPCRDINYDFLFTYGIDDVPSCVDFLYGLRDPKYKKLLTGDKYKNLQYPQKVLGDGYKPSTVPNIREWVKETLPDAGVKSNTTKEKLTEIVEANNLQKAYAEVFGSGMDRTKLVNYIIDNDLEEALVKDVIKRWEFIENTAVAVISNRKRKF